MTAVVSLLDTIARARFELGDIAGAREAWREGLSLARDLYYTYQVPYYLGGLAGVAAHQSDVCRSARLFAAEEEQRRATGAPWSFAETQLRDRDLGLAKRQTNEEMWQQAWVEGQQMTVEQAIEYALELVQETGERRREAEDQEKLGRVWAFVGRHDEVFERAVRVYHDMGNLDAEGGAIALIGRVHDPRKRVAIPGPQGMEPKSR